MPKHEGVVRFDDRLRSTIAANVQGHARRAVAADESRKRAAVAVVIVDDGGAASFLLCRRAARLSRHSAQWALPGGRLDHGETAVDAARRELDEELALDLPESAVVGLLDDYPTRSGYVITPVVLWAAGAVDLVPAPAEVHSVHRIALAELSRPDMPRFVSIPESDRPVVQVPIGDHLIHAPTGAVLVQFRWLALEGRSDPVQHFEQPVFAWR